MSVHNLKFTDHELAKAAGYSDYRELAKAVREQHDPAVVAAERQELQMAADMAWQDQLAKAPPLPAGQARLDAMIAAGKEMAGPGTWEFTKAMTHAPEIDALLSKGAGK